MVAPLFGDSENILAKNTRTIPASHKIDHAPKNPLSKASLLMLY